MKQFLKLDSMKNFKEKLQNKTGVFLNKHHKLTGFLNKSKNNLSLYRNKILTKKLEKLEKRNKTKLGRFWIKVSKFFNKHSNLLHLIIAMIINVIIEAISRHSFMESVNYMVETPVTFLYNAFMIFISFSLVYLVGRRLFARLIISALWLTLGICNGYMLAKRVTPFNAQDLKVMKDGLTLIDSYFSSTEQVLIVVLSCAALLWLSRMYKKGNKFEGKIRRGLMSIVCMGWLGVFMFTTQLALEHRVVSSYFGNIAFAYQDYGLPYCFMSSVFNTGISQPHNYSKEIMDEITNHGEMALTTSSTAQEDPNIIFVQLESFFDPQEVEFLEMSRDPIPNFRQYASEFSSGYFKVPSIGAGTANTEFEVVTGMNMRFFGPGEYPHKTVLKQKPAESAATALKELGYGAHALHNNGGNFYSRAHVFNNLGFDSYTSKEFMNVLQVNAQGWAKDNILTEHIIGALDTTPGADFVLALSVEGHGSYPEDYNMENPIVEVTGLDSEGAQNSWEYFVNLVYEMDVFSGELVEAIEKRGEPTVIVFYGDHLPTLGLEPEDVKNRYLYNTNYVIWNNIDLEVKNQNLASYQIMAEVFEQIGIEAGTVFNYHMDRRKTINYLADLEYIQYDLLYGEQYAYNDQEVLQEGSMQMGIRDVIVSGIVEQLNGTYSIVGDYFTNWSHVYINGEKQSRKFLNNTRIDLEKSTIENGDIITISQVGSSDTIFRTSAVFEYMDGELIQVKDIELANSWINNIPVDIEEIQKERQIIRQQEEKELEIQKLQEELEELQNQEKQ